MNNVDILLNQIERDSRFLNGLKYLLSQQQYVLYLRSLGDEEFNVFVRLVNTRDIFKIRWWLREKVNGMMGLPIVIIQEVARKLNINIHGRDKEELVGLIMTNNKDISNARD